MTSPLIPSGAGTPVPGNTGSANPLNAADFNTGPNKTSTGGGVVPANRGPEAGPVFNPMSSVTNAGGLVSGVPPVSGAMPATNNGIYNGTTIPTTGTTGGVNTASGQSSQLSNQLTDIFGKGVGNLLGSEISNLGSDNSAYIQAYKNAIAPQNAENLSQLQTVLGNEGIGANSSTAAIAQGDFQSNIASQEGLQEQQLTMNDINQLLGLTQNLENPAQQEVGSNAWSDYILPLMQAASQSIKYTVK